MLVVWFKIYFFRMACEGLTINTSKMKYQIKISNILMDYKIDNIRLDVAERKIFDLIKEREEVIFHSFKKCNFKCGDTEMDKQTCQCFNDFKELTYKL